MSILHVICPYCQYDGARENKHRIITNDSKNDRESLYRFQCGECENLFPAFVLDEKNEVKEMNLRNEDGSLYRIPNDYPEYSERSWFMPKDK